MREALAAADHDFVVTELASKLERLREKLLTAGRRASSRIARRGRRYLSFLAAGFFVAVTAAILLDALVWQRARHPAPLFSRAAPAAPKEPTIAGMIVVPPPRPQPAITAVQERDTPLEKLPAQKWPVEKPPLEMPAGGQPQQTSANASPVRPHDKISQLLKASRASPARSTSAATAPAAARKLVQGAQRALVKLGFVLNPDGVAGTATRQAIERYERDHGFPVRGELSRAIIRQLSAETGIAIH